MEKRYYLLGKEYGKDELLSFVSAKLKTKDLAGWEKENYEFIQTWFEDRDYVVAHTSGSTGTPKEILLSKEGMRQSANSTVSFLKLKPQENALLCLSASYIAGKMMIVRALEHGLNLIFCEPTTDAICEMNCEISFCAMVPYQVSKALEKSPNIFNGIKTLIIGGGTVSEELEERLQDIKTVCYSTYGMTETMSHIALKRLNGEKDGVYNCLPNIKVSEDNRGCLVIDYVGKDKIVTNDIVDIVSDRSFIWKGRYDNVINTGGVKLMPESLEQKVSDLIGDRYIFSSLSDNELGDKLILIIEGKSYGQEKIDSLWEELNKRLGKYEVPKDIYFVDKFKETSSGKIIRRGIAI